MPQPYIFSYTFQDTNSVKAPVAYYYVPTNAATVTVAQLITDYQGLGAALDDASNAEIVSGSISLPQDLPGAWKSAPVEENDVSDVLSLTFDNSVTIYGWAALVPNLKNSELTDGKVNLADTDIVALTGFITSGAANGSFTNQAGQDLSALRNGFQADRKHRRQLRSRSLNSV